ncbi:glycosyltransferase family 2 protein [Mangrovihabitans endophyticus]|nr:glycosyltransferase [Mangrovihabitans endophyticus]
MGAPDFGLRPSTITLPEIPRSRRPAHGTPPGRRRADRQPKVVDHRVRRGVRRFLTLLCLLPLILILARQAPNVWHAPLIAGYGFLVLFVTVLLLYVAYVHYEDPSEGTLTRRPKDLSEFPPLTANPRVSFLVAVKDEVDEIETCVRSIVDSDYDNLEVIVIDDGSTDGTTEILARLTDELGIVALSLEKNVGKKNALVLGARRATGDILAFSDSDCYLAPDALGRCVEALVRHPELGAVSGHARASNADESFFTRTQDVWYEGQFRVAKAAEAVFGTVTCVSGPLAVFRREAIYNYLPAWAGDRFLGGEFRFATDRQLTGYVLCQKWTGRQLKDQHAGSPFVTGEDHPERRWRVGYVESAKVWTTVPAATRPFFKQQVRWKKSFIRNLFFTGRYMWRRGVGPALLYYGHALWVVLAPVMAVRHLVWAPLNGLWFLTLLYLCGILLKGTAWGIAFKLDNRSSLRWRYRPFMSLISSLLLAWLLPYSLLTIRRGVWSRGAR